MVRGERIKNNGECLEPVKIALAQADELACWIWRLRTKSLARQEKVGDGLILQ